MMGAMASSRRGRRIGIVALAVVAVLLATAAIALARLPRDDLTMLTPGDLLLGEGLAGTMNAGPLEIELAPEQVTVRHGGDLVWQSPQHVAFLAAARPTLEVTEARGYFWLHTGHDRTWPTQRIDTTEATQDGVVLAGVFLDDGEAGPAWRAEFTPTAHGVVLDAQVTGEGDLSLALWSARSEGAGVHGFGEQFTDFDLDGTLLPIIVREQGVGRGEQPLTFLADLTNNGAGGTEAMTYAAWTSWVTGDLKGVRLDPHAPESHAPAVADMRTPGRIGLEVHAGRIRAELTSASTPIDLIAAQQAPAHRPDLAEWTGEGAIIGVQGGTDKVRATVADLQAVGTQIAGVWLQDWTGQRTTSFGDRLWWTWQLDSDRYPGWPELIADLGEAGIAVTTYVNPFLVDAAMKDPAPARNLFAEAAAADYLVTDTGGEPYPLDQGEFDAYLVDLTNPDARDWFAHVIATEVLTDGVSGFMADFAEGLPFDAVLADGDAHLEHNRWPLLWARTVEQACQLADQPECVRWFRAGSAGMAAHSPLFWNGDQLVTFGREDGLASLLGATFSAGVSGWPLQHADVGGYTSINAVVKDYVRTEELLARWGEFAAFGVVLRTHEGNRPGENLQVYSTPGTRASFARASQIFAALADYRREVVAEAVRTGVPAIRPGWLAAPGTAAEGATDQFFFGPAVLVAPVLTAGADDVEVTFPPGRWRHLLTGEEYDGARRLRVPAPLGTPAAFVEISDPWAKRLTAAMAHLR